MNHRERSEGLVYVYTGPYNIGGKYCEECKNGEETSQSNRKVSALRKSTDEK